MKPDAVIDTDVCSFVFKQSRFGQSYTSMLGDVTPFVSFMTVAELVRWSQRYDWRIRRRMQLEEFLAQLIVYESDRELCDRWAEVTEMGRRAGQPISCPDAWIAATALELDCPLITHNAHDYRMIAGLSIRTASGS